MKHETIEIDADGNAWVYLGEVEDLLYGIPVSKCLTKVNCCDCKKYDYWAPEELIMPIFKEKDPLGHEIVRWNIEKYRARREYMKGFEDEYYKKYKHG